MLRHYLITAWRNLRRNRIYSVVNILGLALALCCSLLVSQFVYHELSFDVFHEKADRVYLVYQHNQQLADTPFADHSLLSTEQKALAENYPGIVRTARVTWINPQIGEGERVFKQKGAAVDPSFFDMFSFPLLRGDPAAALALPHAVVLTETACRQLWGEENPLGQVLSVQVGKVPREFTVTGVLRDIPENSSLRFDVLLSHEALEAASREGATADASGNLSMRSYMHCIFVELAKQVSASELEAQISTLLREDQRSRMSLHLRSVDQLHFAPQRIYGAELKNRGKLAYVYILSGIGLLVLTVACINFTNLALGRASLRAREIGVRKVVGAGRGDLMRQFWGEAVLLSLIALVLGLTLAELLLPFFNNLIERSLELDLTQPSVLLTALGLALLVGTAASAYPAAVLSALRPVTALGRRPQIGGRSAFSRGLIVLQFALSTLLVVCTLGMGRQLDYLQIKGLGFDGDRVIRVSLPYPNFGQVLEVFKNELAAHPQQVSGCVGASSVPGLGGARTTWKFGELRGRCGLFCVDYGFVETLGLDLLSGRDFSPNFATDTDEVVIVNQTLARILGVDDPVGQELVEVNVVGQEKKLRIIGVVNDFHYASLHQKIEPVMLQVGGPTRVQALVRLDAGNIPAALEIARKAWEKVAPDREFHYEFLNDSFAGMYRQEERWGWIVRTAAGCALLIACLGLFGLVALVTGRRTKEIGIRRVLGASARQVVGLLTWEFSVLVVVANLVAWPVTYFVMARWLEGFAYRIELGPGLFLLGGLLTLGIAWLTVSWQAIHASLANPVDALRYE